MIRVKASLDNRRIRRLVWLVLTVSVLLGYSLQSVTGSAYYSNEMQNYATVSSPPVILQNGTAGMSTIYTNSTSAKVRVTGYPYDFVDKDDSNVDSSGDQGTQSNFTAQQAGPDSTYDTLTEENTKGIADYVDQLSDEDSSADWGSHSNFENQKNKDSSYDTLTEATAVGGNWGDATPQGTSTTVSHCRLMGGMSPNIDDMTLKNVSIYISGSGSIRLAVYQGGSLESGPAGATLVYDFGTVTPSGVGWVTATGANVSLAKNEVTWIGWKGNDGTINVFYDTSWDSGSDFQSGNGRFDSSGESTDETYGWDSAFPSGGVYLNYWYSVYLTYDVPTNFGLDLEVQFTDVIDFLPTEKLCIYAGAIGSEDVEVDYWNGTGWENIATALTANSWNNYTVSLTSSTFTVRFKDGTTDGDTIQNQWQIDACLLRVGGAGSKGDPVDQQSNVDGSADVGNHGNFSAQQYGPDSIYDTLTEENTGGYSNSTLLDDGYEAVDWDENWDAIAHNWQEENSIVHSGSASAEANDDNDGDFICDDLNASGAVAIYLDFWFRKDGINPSEFLLYYYNGSSYGLIDDLDDNGADNTWLHYTQKVTDSQYFISNFRIRFYANLNQILGTDYVWVDDVLIKKEIQDADNYELDLEVQWTNLQYTLPNETLCIYGGPMGAEDIKVDVWNGTGWENVSNGLSTGWNNASITNWLTSSNFTIRFRGGTETGDTNQTTWQIDVALIHVWNDAGEENYELDLEVQWTNADYSQTNEELCIKTGTTDAEDIKVDVWNGSTWINVLTDLTADSWNNVSVTSYLNSLTFTIRFKGGNETGDTNQDSWNIDATLLRFWTSQDTLDYVDNNTTDVDSSADKGTHGNFTAQEYLDGIYDTLTEADTSTPDTSDNIVDSETITHGSTTGISGAQTTDGTTENMNEGTIEKIGTDTSGTGSALNGSALNLSFSHTLVSGTNRIVIVTIGIENGNTTDVDSVTYGGQTCTKAIDHTAISTGFRFLVEIWYILDADLPSDGSRIVNVTCSGIMYELEVNAFCSEYAGVTQGAPEATDGYNQTIGSTITNTISPSDNAWVISGVGAGNIGDWAHGEGQVEVLEFDDNSSTFAVAELRGASGETSLSSNYTGTINRLCRACASWTEAATYQLDIEHVVNSIGEYENYNLTTRAYRTAPENFYLQLYNFTSSQWVNMSTITASSLTWYNTSFAKTDFVNSTNQARIRYWQDVDATQETLYVDYSGVYGWNATTNHELDLEVQWTGADYTGVNEELCIKTGTFSGSENIQVKVWNNTGSSWHWVMNLTANQWNNVSVTSYLTSSTFTVQYLGGTETGDTSEDSWNIDVSLLHVSTAGTTYDYVLRVNNTVTDSWQVRLKKYSDSNVNRLQDCTIYFHNSTDGTSNQIIIENGSYINQTGPWYDLGDSETIYIAMTVKANDAATSYVYAYLEIRTPNTTTYAQYVITFEIT